MAIDLYDIINKQAVLGVNQTSNDSGMPSEQKQIRELKEAYLRSLLGNTTTATLLGREQDQRAFVLDQLEVVPMTDSQGNAKENLQGQIIYTIRPKINLSQFLATPEAKGYFPDLAEVDPESGADLQNPLITALERLQGTPRYGLLGQTTVETSANPLMGERTNYGFSASEYLTNQITNTTPFGQDLDPADAVKLKEEILRKLNEYTGGDAAKTQQIYEDFQTKLTINPTNNLASLAFNEVDPEGNVLTQSGGIVINMPDPTGSGIYSPRATFAGAPRTAAATATPEKPYILWNTATKNTEFLFPDPETGQFVMPPDPNLMLFDVAVARDLVDPAVPDPTVQVPFGPGPDDTYGISPDTYFTQGSADERSRQALLAEQATLDESIRNNDLIEASKRARLAQEQAQFQANMAESQGQFDRSLALNSFAQQSRDEATRIEAELEMSRQNIDRLNQITTALSRPSDAVAASFALTGNQSPMGIFTQADAINPYIADMMDRRSAVDAFGPGFQAEDFMEGRGKRQNPLTGFDEDGGGNSKDIISISSTDSKGNQTLTLRDGSTIERPAPVPPKLEHGGVAHGFSNPIIVGDSSDNKENQELVMSFGNAPMVVLPLNEQQEKIMERANSSVPRAQNGYPGVGEYDPNFNPYAGMTGVEFDENDNRNENYIASLNPDDPRNTGPRAPRASSIYNTADYGIGGQPMNQGTISSQQAAFAPTGRQGGMGNPGLAGFESMYPLTQGMIQDRSDMLASPRVRQVLQGTAGEGSFRQRPTQMPFALPTPGFMRNLTGTEREFLKSNLATRNIFLDDVETAVAQRFGRTNTSQGRRRFN